MTLDKEKAEEYFINIASQYEEYWDIKDSIRNLHSCDVLTDDEYNYILQEWDNLLKKHNL